MVSPKPIIPSKNRKPSGRQCLKQPDFKVRYSDLEVFTTTAEATLEYGKQPGALARQLHTAQDTVFLDFGPEKVSKALADTECLVRKGHRFPVFEATFQHIVMPFCTRRLDGVDSYHVRLKMQ